MNHNHRFFSFFCKYPYYNFYIYLFIFYLMFYSWPPTLFTCIKISDTCELQFRWRSRLKPSRYLQISVSAVGWWRDEPPRPLTARRGVANEMEPERMWLVTELLGFDDRRGACGALLCDGQLKSCLADGSSPLSWLAEKLQWGSCPGSWPFEASHSSPLSLHKLSGTHTTLLFE